MPFNEKLPEWNNAGVEPPQSKKDEGFSPGEKPPAQWFNWLLNRIYKAIQELREKVVVKVAGKDLSSNDYTTEEKIKLGGISKQATKVESSSINGNVKIDGVNAKVYEHPSSHPAEMIEESATKKFVSTSQINNWDSKETPTGAQAKANTAEQNAKNYADTAIGSIQVPVKSVNNKTGDVTLTVVDVGAETPSGAQSKANAAASAALNAAKEYTDDVVDPISTQMAESAQNLIAHEGKSATTSQKGHIEIATQAETTAGTDTSRAVPPAYLKVELDKKLATANLLTEIKKVDGAGSGLDADYLRGFSPRDLFELAVFGDGSDGVFNSAGNTTFPSVVDGDPVVKRYSQFTLNSGHTLTVSNRCKGLVIFCTGDVTINGTVNMNAKSGAGIRLQPNEDNNWKNNIQLPIINSVGTITVLNVLSGGRGGQGGEGGSAITSNYQSNTSGSIFAFGGGCGGSGGAGYGTDYDPYTKEGLGGGGGGAGNGGKGGDAAGIYPSEPPTDTAYGTGGAGGTAKNYQGGNAQNGSAGGAGGGGGIVIIVAKGTVTINGTITANGTGTGGKGGNGDTRSDYRRAPGGGGGGCGGGSVTILSKTAINNNGTITVNGSAGGAAGVNTSKIPAQAGQSGSTGSIVTKIIGGGI